MKKVLREKKVIEENRPSDKYKERDLKKSGPNIDELDHMLSIYKILQKLENLKTDRKGFHRKEIILDDTNAPLCINCKFCEQQGFLFICTQFQWPEDGRIAGLFGGIVYYKRKGHHMCRSHNGHS